MNFTPQYDLHLERANELSLKMETSLLRIIADIKSGKEVPQPIDWLEFESEFEKESK